MDRVAGWYKRRVQQIVFIMGFIVAIVMNADTFAIFKNLANDRPLRAAIVAQSKAFKDTSIGNSKADIIIANDKIKNNVNTLLQMGLPIGWGWKSDINNDKDAIANFIAIPPRSSKSGWLFKVVGWIITGLAISLGAPFWFDILNKIMVIRSTVKPTEKSPDEGSEDKKH